MAKKKARKKKANPDIIDPTKAGWKLWTPPGGGPYEEGNLRPVLLPPEVWEQMTNGGGGAAAPAAPAAAPAADPGAEGPATGAGPAAPTPVVPQYLQEMFNQYGLGGLAQWYLAGAVAGKTEAQLSEEVYDTPEYQAIFPAMKALRSKNRALREDQYMALQRSYEDVLYAYGLRGSVFDSKATFTKLMESEVSARELEERVADAKMVIDSADENVRKALVDYYGIGAQDLMIYALDPQGQGKDHVERMARSATLQGLARSTSLQLSRQYTETLAMDSAFDNSTEADMRNVLSDVTDVSRSQGRLAAIDQQAWSDEDAADVVVRRDAGKTLASRQRAAREQARFAGTSGTGSRSLARTGI